MTVLNLHKKECLEIAKRILDWNFIDPILVKTNSLSHMDTLMIIDGKKLAERLKKILADGSLLGQKEEIELKQTSKGLEVKDTDIERLERSYQEQGFFINAVSLEY